MILVDANVLLDVFTSDPVWFEWSSCQLVANASENLAINPLICAEISAGYPDEATLEKQLSGWKIERLPLPYAAAFPAGKAFLAYRKRCGTKHSPLPDFYIGSHALTSGLTLLTRDATRYRTYFPRLSVIAPVS